MSARSRILKSLLLLTFAVVIVAPRAGANTNSGVPNINGKWSCCGSTGGAYPQTMIYNGATGYEVNPAGSVFASLQITQNGQHVHIVSTYNSFAPGYVAISDGVLSPDGKTISGTWTSNRGQSGTFVETLLIQYAPTLTSTGSVAPIAASIGTPGQIFHSMSHNFINAIITVGAILLITFPANIFNQTFTANYAEILGLLARWRRRIRGALHLSSTTRTAEVESRDQEEATLNGELTSPGRANPVRFGAVLLTGALLGALLNPGFGVNGSTAAGLIATLLAFSFSATISFLVARAFRQRHGYPTSPYLQALPLGLLIASLCVLISRISNFQPGYLYGIVVSIAFVKTLEARHAAQLIAISVISTLAVAMSAWILWIPVNHIALEHSSNLILAAVDDMLGSIFIGGLVGSVVSLLPLQFLPGAALVRWRKDVWAAVMFLAMFLLIEVELRPQSGPTHSGGAPWVTVVVLFLFFGGSTLAMRSYFARIVRERAVAEETISAAELPQI